MSSSDDDAPLSRVNGAASKASAGTPNGANGSPPLNPGLSVRNGPLSKIDVASPAPQSVKRRASAVNGSHSYKDLSGSDEDEDLPLSKRHKKSSVVSKPPKITHAQIGGDSDSDEPLGQQLVKEKAKIEQRANKAAKAIRAEEQSDRRKKKVKRELESDDDEEPLTRKSAKFHTTQKKAKTSAANGASTKSAKPGKTPSLLVKRREKSVKREQDDEDADVDAEEEEYKWWEDHTKDDGSQKWTTLQHNGVMFPPEYQPLPSNVKLIYDGMPVTLKPEAEEVAVFYGSMLHSTVNVENAVFNKNFFADFKEVLGKSGPAKDRHGDKVNINEFKKCDFRPIFEHFEAERARNKSRSTEEKKQIKAEKEKVEAPFMYCLWDGRKQKVGNFRVEPPGLFRGRGEHPKTGRVKKRVQPEQVTINIGEEATVPAAPEGHRWKEIKHDQTGTWLAMWQENINGAYKYVMLAANSDIKGQSDFKKFEKARELKKHIDRIRKDYQKELKSNVMADRQRATAMYLIDQFALRAGNEKGEDEADTVGCCSLKFEHVTLQPPNTVIFDFLGKDSIRFYNEFQVHEQVFKNLKLFKKAPKKDGDEIFDRLTTSSLNKHLSSYMVGLTAKVFRTYNASWTMSNLLRDMKSEGAVLEKVKDYNDANRKVAILCNHKRTVAAGHAGQMEKMQEKINGMRYQQWRLKQMMIDVDPKIKKKKGTEFFALPHDLGEEWVKVHQESMVEQEREKIKKKFSKENEKLAAEGQKEMKTKELDLRLEVAQELAQKFRQENKTKKIIAEGRGPTVDKLQGNIEKLDERIANASIQAEDKDNNKEVALGTSKINYIDPRLTVVFSKKFNVPIEKFFSKTLREKFDWAIKSVGADWEF